MRMQLTVPACVLLFAALAQGQAPATPAPFHWHDDYTEYHLLAPDTHQFAIVYFVNQRQAGLTYVLNQTRSGSEGSGIAVSDPRTGEPLKFDYMTGRELAAAGVQGRLNAEEHYIRAHLPRPVPAGGEGRVRIEKTYKDEKSYFSSGETITFARSLGIGRNAIVLPAGFTLMSSNVAAIVEPLEDGRLRLSFENINGYASDVNIRAAKRTSSSRAPGAGGATPASTFAKTLYELRADGTVTLTHDFVSGSGLIPGDGGPAQSMQAFDMDPRRPHPRFEHVQRSETRGERRRSRVVARDLRSARDDCAASTLRDRPCEHARDERDAAGRTRVPAGREQPAGIDGPSRSSRRSHTLIEMEPVRTRSGREALRDRASL